MAIGVSRLSSRSASLAVSRSRQAPGRPPDAAGAEVVRRGRAGAAALLQPAGRRGAHRGDDAEAQRGAPAARRADADRQELAVAVVPGGQQPRHPGARRLRLHPRLRRRAALPRQPAQPDPRGHPRHPGPGPARPQGRHAGRRRAAACWPRRSRDHRPRRRHDGECAAAARRAALDRVVEVDAALWAPGDPVLALANASVYLEAVGHMVVAWIWLEQLLAAGDATATSTTASGGGGVLLPLRAAARPVRSSTCWPRWTPPRGTWTPTCSDPDGPATPPTCAMRLADLVFTFC